LHAACNGRKCSKKKKKTLAKGTASLL